MFTLQKILIIHNVIHSIYTFLIIDIPRKETMFSCMFLQFKRYMGELGGKSCQL